MSRHAALVAKVKAVNAAHQLANDILPQLQAVFTPFVGHQVVKKDGTLLEKVKKLLPALPNTHRLQVYRHSSDYSLAFTVKACEMIGDTCTCLYYEVTVYVGELERDTLKALMDPTTFRTDFTVQEITQKRAALETARKAMDAARSALYPFAEQYDN